MDDRSIEVAGSLTAHSFILENLYAALFAREDDPLGDCRATAREMLRQFEELAPSNPGGVDGDTSFQIIQHGLHRLERFWARVEDRLSSHLG